MATILLVDDEPDIRSVLGQVLRDAGYRVVTAANGADALERMRERRPDGIVLDLNMPVMDGKAFLSASRAEPAYATIPVALFTTALGAETLADSLGVQACIAKPFDLDIFTNAVRQLVSTEAQPPEATPEWPLEMPEWLIESMRSELLALDRRIHETRRTLDRAHDRVIASDACLHRAFERLQRSGRLVSARALASS